MGNDFDAPVSAKCCKAPLLVSYWFRVALCLWQLLAAGRKGICHCPALVTLACMAQHPQARRSAYPESIVCLMLR